MPRRSARIRSGSAQKDETHKVAPVEVPRLSNVQEVEEPVATKQKKKRVSSHNGLHLSIPGAFENYASEVQTPRHLDNAKPEFGEMHPSKVHGSTMKPGALSEQTVVEKQIENLQTPTKSHDPVLKGKTPAKPFSSDFDFRFTRIASKELSDEAQRIMDNVREEALRIKEDMHKQKETQANLLKEAEALCVPKTEPTTNISAKPKARGRFSAAHDAQFSKMKSIAQRPASAANSSKNESHANNIVHHAHPIVKRNISPEYDNQTSSPAKRVKLDPKSTAPSTFKVPATPKTTIKPRSQLNKTPRSLKPPVPHTIAGSRSLFKPSSNLFTPTKASLARTQSVKSLKTLDKPETPTKSYLTPSKIPTSIKSILHKHIPKFSTDPKKVADGTHLPLEHAAHIPILATPRKVDFSPSAKPEVASERLASPSPAKFADIATARPITYPTLPSFNGTQSGKSLNFDFTFRAETAKPVVFAAATSTPRSARKATPRTIRQVRASGIPTPLAPVALQARENVPGVPSLPHGLSAKKRARGDSVHEDEDKENETERGAKRAKVDVKTPSKLSKSTPASEKKLAAQSGKKKGLSQDRINALAMPKRRVQV